MDVSCSYGSQHHVQALSQPKDWKCKQHVISGEQALYHTCTLCLCEAVGELLGCTREYSYMSKVKEKEKFASSY